MNNDLNKLLIFFKQKKNINIRINIIKNYISFNLEKYEKEKNVNIYKKPLIKSYTNLNTYISKIKNKRKTLLFLNGELIKKYNTNDMKIYYKINKEIIKDLKDFKSDCINNNLNLNYITNHLFCKNKTFIKVPKNLVIKNPINIMNIYINSENKCINNEIYIILDDKAEINIINHNVNKHINLSNNTNTNIYLKKSSTLKYSLINSNKKKSLNENSIYAKQLAESTLHFKEFISGNNFLHSYKNFFLIGKKSKIEKKIGNMLTKNTEAKTACNINHYGKESSSSILVKTITKDKSNYKFKGNINVSANTEKTSSKLTCNGIMISNNSSIEFTPELSINNNNVMCSHAATIGNINENVILYMQTRGLKKKECINIITKVFLDEIL